MTGGADGMWADMPDCVPLQKASLLLRVAGLRIGFCSGSSKAVLQDPQRYWSGSLIFSLLLERACAVSSSLLKPAREWSGCRQRRCNSSNLLPRTRSLRQRSLQEHCCRCCLNLLLCPDVACTGAEDDFLPIGLGHGRCSGSCAPASSHLEDRLLQRFEGCSALHGSSTYYLRHCQRSAWPEVYTPRRASKRSRCRRHRGLWRC